MLARESGAKAGTCRWSIDERYRITTRLASSGLTIDACTGLKPPAPHDDPVRDRHRQLVVVALGHVADFRG